MARSRRTVLQAGAVLSPLFASGCLDRVREVATGGAEASSGPVEWQRSLAFAPAGVADGRLYGFASVNADAAGLVALDAATGEQAWQYGEVGGFASYTDLSIADAVYLGWNDDAIGNGNGHLAAVDRDGSERWRVETGSVYWPPVVRDGTVYAGSDDGRLYAVDAATGDEVWQVPIEATETGLSNPRLLGLENGTLVVDPSTPALLGVDPADGTVRWRYEVGDRLPSVVLDDGVYVVGDDAVVSLTEGTERWTAVLDASDVSLLGRLADRLVASAGRSVVGLAADGTRDWTWRLPREPVLALGTEAVHAGVTELRSISPGGGIVRSMELDGTRIETLATDGRVVYAATEEGLHRVGPDGTVSSTTAVSGPAEFAFGDRVYVATDGGIQVLDL